jgi:tetratricopeptide (TPR) repeat protein
LSRIRRLLQPGVFYIPVTLLLWPLPLFNILHVESAAVLAGAAFGISGLTAFSSFRHGESPGRVMADRIVVLLVPLAMMTATLFWVPNCGYLTGLMFFLVFVPVSAVFGIALAFFIHAAALKSPRTWFVLIGAGVTIGGVVYDMALHPQFYSYNHVFGGVLGPIYDDELAIRPGLFFFRLVTLAWSMLLIFGGQALLSGSFRRFRHLVAMVVLSILLAAAYAFSDRIGFNTTETAIQRQLDEVMSTEHFDIYFASGSLSFEEARYIGWMHEFRLEQLVNLMGVSPSRRVRTYIYPTPEVRADLVGARYTNVAPVWLRQPQIHILIDAFDRVFAHELAHVLSREFALPVLGASPLVGLVEGFAVAVEPPHGTPGIHEQVSAASIARVAIAGQGRLAEEVAIRLGPFGFWTGRGAVSYTTMGSFVRYLIDAYGPERFMIVYRTGRFRTAYGKEIVELASEWEAYLRDLPLVSRATGVYMTRRFTVPSLFEVRCPHYIPPHRRLLHAGGEALAEGDTSRAVAHFEEALRREPLFVPARIALSRVLLAIGSPPPIVTDLLSVDEAAEWPAALILKGDAFVRAGDPDSAEVYFRNALGKLPLTARDARAGTILRLATTQQARVAVTGASGVDPLDAAEYWRLGQYARASERFDEAQVDRTLPAAWAGELKRSLPAGRARSLVRRGDVFEGAALGREVASQYRVVGDLGAAAFYDDLADFADWIASRQAKP